MDDAQSKAIDDYVKQVKNRFQTVIDLILFLPASTPHFFPNDIKSRMPKADKKELSRLLANARELREQVSQCEENIVERQSEAIQRAGDVENGKSAPAEATPLFLIVHGLFDETIRLSALAMQSISLSRDIARLLEKASTPEEAAKGNAEMMAAIKALQEQMAGGFAAAAQDRAKKAAEHSEKLNSIHRHTEGVPPLVHAVQTEEGRAIVNTDAVLKTVRCTQEERNVFTAWFNNGGTSLSQSEVARKTRLSIPQVRRRAQSFNKKANGKGVTIVWQSTPARDRSAKARDKVHATK